MLSTYLIYFGFWAVYYAIHSILAMDQVKARIPIPPQLYRLLYSLISVLLLFYVLFAGAVQPTFNVITPGQSTKVIALSITVVGVFIVKRAFRNYSLRSFLGIKKEDNQELKIDGIQARMRHPLYTGTVLVVTGFFFFSPSMINLTTLISLLVYLPIGIWLEEKKLVRHFGQAYIDYRKRVPALFPNPFKNRDN